MRHHHKRPQKKATNERGDKETQLINLRAAGADSEGLQNEIRELRLKYPGYTSMYDSNNIPMLKKLKLLEHIIESRKSTTYCKRKRSCEPPPLGSSARLQSSF